MSTGIGKSKASGIALMGKVLVAGGILGVSLFSRGASAASTTNTQFYQYIADICSVVTVPPSWDANKVLTMCVNAFPGGLGASPMSSNVSLGVSSVSGGISSAKKKKVQELLDDEKKKIDKSASSDGGGWGFLVTPQYSKLDRNESDLENGYHAELTGLNVGLDYRFSDSFILGGTVGKIKDNATFLNNAGSLKTSTNSFSMYATWLASEKFSIDGYLGYSKLNLDTRRNVVFMTIAGAATGSTSGNQLLGGLSTSYQMESGRFNLSPFFSLDYIKTTFKGYQEQGSTLLELRFSDRRASSLTSSLGGRVGTTHSYNWGVLNPSIRLAAVHEFQNNSQQIRNELVITPGTSMAVTTDAPDRNYLNLGLSVSAAMNRGGQLFLDYEKRTQDKLLNSWAVSLGGLFEF